MSPRSHALFRLALVAATLMVTARTSRAGESAEELIRRSIEARRAGDDQGALRLLRQAYADGQTPHAAGQLGLCEQAMGLWAEAEAHVVEALKAANDPWVRKNHAVLIEDVSVIRSHLARVEVHGEPAGARVTINGKDVGALPLAEPVRVAAGDVDIAVAAPGLATARKSVHVEAGQYEHVTLSAAAAPATTAPATTTVPATPSTPSTTAAPAPDAAAPSSPPVVKASYEAPDTSGVWRPRAKWIAWGAGVVALGVGVYGIAENTHLASVFDSAGCSIKGGQPVMDSTGAPSSVCTTKHSDYESASHLAVGAFIGAAVLGATGAILWLTEPKTDDAHSVLAACRPTLGARLEPWLACSLRF
jgi:hypothetical protein